MSVPIVLARGTRFSAGQWSPQLSALREEFPVVAVDLPGHGARRGEPWSPTAACAAVAAGVEELGRFEPGALRRIEAPVLILNGEKDPAFRSGERALAAAHPRGRARVQLVPRARHLANLDAPEAVTDAVRRFAREL
ncbi:alpha/beta fold hydrolase [Kitasatospora sp. NPDC091257]|uniref:alpha/beta fold hydrolase n=1 Tax=Kitasatospora sp. NPDC091257 TaxID=3364084 RepID=UPI0037FECCFB